MHMSETPFPTLLSFFFFFIPTPESVQMDGVRWRHNQIFWQKPGATILHVVRFIEEGSYGQPKYCFEKAIYFFIISFALDFFFFGSIGFNFLFRMGLHCVRERFARKKEIRQV